jgi:predicted outer membrane protein
MWMSRWFLALGCLALPATVLAQQAERPERPAERTPQTDRAAQPAQPNTVEGFFVECLTQANQAEVALGRIAEQRATDKEVQAFAEQMVKDHSAMLAKLQKLSPNKSAATTTDRGEAVPRRAVEDPAVDRAPPERRVAPGTAPEGARTAAPGGRPASGQNDLHAIAKINEEIHKRCLASAMEELEGKKGEEFDKCYTGMQIAAHQKMSDALAVLKNHVTTPELRQVITQGSETTQQHLSHAKNLMKSLDRATATAKRDTDEQPERK